MTGKQPVEAVVTQNSAHGRRAWPGVAGGGGGRAGGGGGGGGGGGLGGGRGARGARRGDGKVGGGLVTIAPRKAIDVPGGAARRAIPVAQPPGDTVAPAADSAGDG